MKIAFLFLVLTAALPSVAQTLKFDSFLTQEAPFYFFDKEVTFKDRLNRFVRQLKKERRTKVYLVHYRARVVQWNPYTNSERLAENAKWDITGKTNIDPEDVLVINGGIRDADTLEFWIGRKNSGPPELTPSFTNADAVTCPSIYLNNQGFNLTDAEPLEFSASLYPKADSRYSWSVSPAES